MIKAIDTPSIALFRFLISCQSLALFLLDTFCLLFPKKGNRGLKEKVLVIRLDGIGDFILWLDSAKELKKVFPPDRYEIILLGNQLWTSLAQELPYFDQVWQLTPRKFIWNLLYRMRIAMHIRQAGFSIAVQPTYSRSFILDDPIVRMSGARQRIGYQGDYSNSSLWQKRISDQWYTRLIPATPKPVMELTRNAEFMRGIGVPEFKSCVATLPLKTVPLQKLLPDNYFVVFPGAGVAVRQWPLLRFMQIAEKLYQATGWIGVFCGGPADEKMGTDLEDRTRIPLQNLIGKTSLLDLASIIRGARLLIGNDTSAIHIAAAVSTPSIAVFGGGHFGRFLPYQMECQTERPLPVPVYHSMNCFNCNWRCLYQKTKSSPGQCIEMVTAEMVWNAIQNVLQERAPHSRNP